MNFIRPFSQISKADAALAGGKGASLGEMTQAGIPVPPGFVVLAGSFDAFLDETGLRADIDATLHTVSHKDIATVEHASDVIRELILSAALPEALNQEIIQSFQELQSPFVAVRSSATAEDSASAAWAGQLDSFLNTTEETLLDNVKKCWASLFTPRAIFYRFEKELHEQHISVAVVVQAMVNSECSGIAFSVHPVTEDRNQMIIEAGFGLGEAIVSGQITPDSYVVEKEPRQIIDMSVATQTRALYRVHSGGNEWRDIAEPQASSQVLSEAQIIEFAELVMKIENHYGFPCDIEWAFENGKFYIVQSRPITTLHIAVSTPPIDEYVIPRDRQALLAPSYWAGVTLTNSRGEQAFGKTLPLINCLYHDGNLTVVIPKQAWENLGVYVADRLVHEAGYFEGHEEHTRLACARAAQFFAMMAREDLTGWSLPKLCSTALQIADMTWDYDSSSVFSWFTAADRVKTLVGEALGVRGEDLDMLAMPEEKTAATHMEGEVLAAGLSTEPVEPIATRLSVQYFWMPYGYDGPTTWSPEHFATRITDARENRQETKRKYDEQVRHDDEVRARITAMMHENKFSPAQLRLLHILRTLALWTDERKMVDFQLFYWYGNILEELAKRYDLSPTLLRYLFTNELAELEHDALALKARAAQRQAEHFMIIVEKGIIRFGSVAEIAHIKSFMVSGATSSEIKGTVACRGPETIYRARVKVLRSSQECVKVEKGDWLVAPMTTPDYVPAMERALGFITNEGGVTCHAAIVAREMNKPCVIGTKNATKILKDGDVVEVDANTGVVRVVK